MPNSVRVYIPLFFIYWNQTERKEMRVTKGLPSVLFTERLGYGTILHYRVELSVATTPLHDT